MNFAERERNHTHTHTHTHTYIYIYSAKQLEFMSPPIVYKSEFWDPRSMSKDQRRLVRSWEDSHIYYYLKKKKKKLYIRSLPLR